MILLNLLNRKKNPQERIPLWFMRQAGRTLPEYRELRKRAGSFWEMCFNPTFTVEATLQPLRRFDIDAAILFSDILTVPKALGQAIDFYENIGPVCDPEFIEKLPPFNKSFFEGQTEPVMDSLGKIASQLSLQQTLIGFAGGPFTVACYMIEGKKSKTHLPIKTFIYRYPEKFQQLLTLLVEATCVYLLNQIKAGAQVIQLFESWADVLPYQEFYPCVFDPLIQIARTLKQQAPHVPLIVFPRGASAHYADYVKTGLFSGISLDHQISFPTLLKSFPGEVAFQGGIDPAKLLVGGDPLKKSLEETLLTFQGKRYIANLSHGLDPQIPIENIEFFIKCVRDFDGRYAK